MSAKREEAPRVECVSLEEDLAQLVRGADDFKRQHGSVEVVVGPNSLIAKAGIQKVADYDIQVDAVRLVDHTEARKPDIVIDYGLVYYVTHDNPMYGRNANDDDWDRDDFGDDFTPGDHEDDWGDDDD